MITDERLKELIEELEVGNSRAWDNVNQIVFYLKELLTLRQEEQTKDAVIESLTADYIEENELLRQEKQDLIENAERLEKSLRFAKDYIDEGDIDYGNCDDALDQHAALMDKIKEE